MRRAITRAASVLVVGLGVGACQPSDKEAAPLRVENAHMRVMPPGQTRAAVYLSVINAGGQDRQVLNVDASIAGQVQVHRHSYDNGVMKMRQVEHVVIPAGGRLDFAPGGYHLMLLDIDEQPAQGDEFTVNVEFDGGDVLTFPVEVRSL